MNVFTCDENGRTIEIDDISVTFPPGSIPAGMTAHVELGVALYGPFSFPDDYRPVSPFIWLCIQEELELQLPIAIKLPHMVVDIEGDELAFAKANHLDFFYDSAKGYQVFFFDSVIDGESYFTNLTEEKELESGYGILRIKHCCLYCIKAKISPGLGKRLGYCLHTFLEEKGPSQCRILHVCTYCLKQCFKASSVSFNFCLVQNYIAGID